MSTFRFAPWQRRSGGKGSGNKTVKNLKRVLNQKIKQVFFFSCGKCYIFAIQKIINASNINTL
jgi:hypothetical protein